MSDHIFRVELALQEGKAHRIAPDLEEKELAAIGYVTTQWAFLEHAILDSTNKIATENGAPIPTDAFSLMFAKRLRAWRSTIEQFVTEPSTKDKLLKIASKAANLAEKRHQLAHALWTSEPSDPQTMQAFSFRPNVEFDVDFDFEGILQLGDKIGELNFDLIFPGGKEDAWKSFIDLASEKGTWVSRSFLLSVMEKRPQKNRRPRRGTPSRSRTPKSR